jgi:hypothetical protein
VEALPAGAQRAVDEDAVTGGVVAFGVVPGRSGHLRAVDVPGGAESVPYAVGEVFAVGVGDGQGDRPGGTVGSDVGDDGVGEGFPRRVRGAEVMFPAGPGADGLAEGDVSGPVVGERVAFGGFELAAVRRELRGRDAALVAEAGEFGTDPARPRTDCAWWRSPRHHSRALCVVVTAARTHHVRPPLDQRRISASAVATWEISSPGASIVMRMGSSGRRRHPEQHLGLPLRQQPAGD